LQFLKAIQLLPSKQQPNLNDVVANDVVVVPLSKLADTKQLSQQPSIPKMNIKVGSDKRCHFVKQRNFFEVIAFLKLLTPC